MKSGSINWVFVIIMGIIIALIVAIIYGCTVLLQWFINTYMHPSEPVGIGLCLFFVISGFVIFCIYCGIKMAETDKKINFFIKKGEQDDMAR